MARLANKNASSFPQHVFYSYNFSPPRSQVQACSGRGSLSSHPLPQCCSWCHLPSSNQAHLATSRWPPLGRAHEPHRPERRSNLPEAKVPQAQPIRCAAAHCFQLSGPQRYRFLQRPWSPDMRLHHARRRTLSARPTCCVEMIWSCHLHILGIGINYHKTIVRYRLSFSFFFSPSLSL